MKSGDPSGSTNNRQLSVLPVPSKVFERIVSNQLVAHLEKNIFSHRQFDFRAKSSTCGALALVSENLYNSLDDNKISLIILIDLSKAFDSLSRDDHFPRILR